MLSALLSCSKQGSDEPAARELTSFESDLSYEYLEGNFTNPERGSYAGQYFTFIDGKLPALISEEKLAAPRGNGCSLSHMSVYLHDFMNSDISDEALNLIDEQFDLVRKAGCKMILRFAYSYSDDPQMNPSTEQILRHISQLKPLLQKNEDIIYVMQAGFVGAYGEWHSDKPVIDNDGRRQIVLALLEALPVSRQVAVRTPAQKRMVLQTEVSDTITVRTAFDGSNNSRLAGHNDCFLANGSDGGTYNGFGDRRMWMTESKYTIMGGESCFMGSTDCYECENAGNDLTRYHYSYLSNVAQVTQVWKEGECNDDYVSRIGYRFALDSAAFRGDFKAGGRFKIQFSITNHGFASLINPRKMEFVFENASDPAEKYVFVSDKDIRRWMGGKQYLHEEVFTLPEGIKAGQKYNIYLAFPDIAESLHDDPRFSIRLANKGVWDSQQGYNLLASITAE